MRHFITGIAVVAAAFGGLSAHAQQFEYGDYYGRHDYSNGLPPDVQYHSEGTPAAPNPFGYYQHQASWNPVQAMPRPLAPVQHGYAPQASSPYYGTPVSAPASPYPVVHPYAQPQPNFGPLPPPPPTGPIAGQRGTPQMRPAPAAGQKTTPSAFARDGAPSHNHHTADEFELAPLRDGNASTPRSPQPRANTGAGQLPRKNEPNW